MCRLWDLGWGGRVESSRWGQFKSLRSAGRQVFGAALGGRGARSAGLGGGRRPAGVSRGRGARRGVGTRGGSQRSRASQRAGAVWLCGRDGLRPVRRRAGSDIGARFGSQSRCSPSRWSCWVQTIRSWALSASSSHAALGSNAWKGRCETPVAFTELDAVFDLGVLTVGLFQRGEIVAGLVGDEALEAVTVEICEREAARRGVGARAVRSIGCHRASPRGSPDRSALSPTPRRAAHRPR